MILKPEMHIGSCRYYCPPCFGSRKKKKKTNAEENNKKKASKPDSSGPASVLEPSTRKNRPAANDTAEVFTYEELATATNNFWDEDFIGRGGFGAVYKGRLKRSGQLVAVKQLDKTGLQGEKEFLVEVLMLSLMRHPNLVHLLGFCAEGDQRLLVYEYMPLGSLEDYLFDLPPEKEPLDWNTRMMIAAGAAKGLEYLHNEAEPPVIYRDLKCANILLGEGFHPKLSDFGLAKFGPTGDKSHVSTRVMGTHGYCAPEYMATGKLTVKSDIFSLGVVLLELVSGRPAMDDSRGRERMLVDWARPRYKDRKNLTQLADPLLKGQFSRSSLKKALEVAFLCVHDNPANRPSITDVVYALDYIASRQYDPSETDKVQKKVPDSPKSSASESAWMIGGKDLDRQQAVAEAKMWGETLREKQQQQGVQSHSEGTDSWVNKIQKVE